MSQSKVSGLSNESVPPLLRAEQVAEMLNVKASTVYEWVRMKYIPNVRLGTGNKKPLVRFDRTEIREWLETRKKAGRTKRVPELN